MKKIAKSALALLLAALMLLSLFGCGATGKAETTVRRMFEALKDLDFEEAGKYVEMADLKLSEDEGTEDADYEMYMSTLFDRLDYKILSSREVDENTVNVTVEVTAVDMKTVLGQYMLAALQFAFGSALGSDLSEEESQKELQKLFAECASKEDVGTVTAEVTVKVVNENGSWKVDADDSFVDALFGGLVSATKSLSDSLANLGE